MKKIEIKSANVTIEGNKVTIEADEEILKNVGQKKLSECPVGSVINDKYIVLEHFNDDTTAVITKELLFDDRVFSGGNNDWRNSSLRSYLNREYKAQIETEFGSEAIISHNINLLSLDGLNTYGTFTDKVALFTIDDYRKYRRTLGYDMPRTWWLITPDSTNEGCDADCVSCVDPSGDVSFGGCDYWRGVRPFFYLSSNILVTCGN